MFNLTSLLDQLEQERARLISQLEHLNSALSALNGTGNRTARRISNPGRARIAAAQHARWAKQNAKGRKVVSIATKRTMSPGARKRIAAAQRARWAEWRKQHKG